MLVQLWGGGGADAQNGGAVVRSDAAQLESTLEGAAAAAGGVAGALGEDAFTHVHAARGLARFWLAVGDL